MTTLIDYLNSAKNSIALGHKEIKAALLEIDADKEARGIERQGFEMVQAACYGLPE